MRVAELWFKSTSHQQFECALRIAACGCIVALAACTGGKNSGAHRAAAMRPDASVLIEKTLRRAVVEEKDITDYNLLRDQQTIVLSSLVPAVLVGDSQSQTAQLSAAPQFQDVALVLKSPDEIEQRADAEGDFLYLRIERIAIAGELATVMIATHWAVSKANVGKRAYLSGGGYELQFVKRAGEWEFNQVLRAWSS